jgi:phosphoacetylglucosamine mutase
MDNGIKFIGADGFMMKTQFEKYVEEFANIEDLQEACRFLEDALVNKLNEGKPIDWNEKGYVLVGCDTRMSSPLLIGNLMEAISFSGSEYLNFGVITTPQLHYMSKKSCC